MKKIISGLFGAVMLIAASLQTHAQGTLVYDQQSASSPIDPVGNGNADGLYIQEDQPLVQSFIPTLSAIGFVQLEFEDPLLLNNGTNGATVYVKLWAGSPNIESPSDTLLGSTAPVYMPNGFETSYNSTGVTNFYFSTPVTLTAGQTYYLQPVVLSGDNPWPIVTIGDTYPNGQVFEDGEGFNTDFWFRQGVVSVPEPSALALIGLSSLLVFGFKRRSKLVVPLLLIASILPVYSTPDSVVQATADEAGLAPATAASLPDTGTFWVMTNTPDGLIALPYPELPSDLSVLPIYSVVGSEFIVDDTGGQLAPSTGRMSSAQATSTAQTQAATMASLIEQILYPTNSGDGGLQFNYNFSFDTNCLWLEASNEVTSLGLRLHNTIGGDNYQLLSTTNLESGWNLGEILNAPDVQMDFTPVPRTNAVTFFKAHHANPVMAITDWQDSEEMNPTNTGDPGYPGYFYVFNNGWQTNDVTVYYSIGGTAQNGIDYSNLTGEVVVPLDSYYTEINIDPIADGLKPNQTVILTLLQNTNYLIDPANYSATNNLRANPQVYPTIQGDLEQPCSNSSTDIHLDSDVNDPRGLPLTYTILTYPMHGSLDTNSLPSVTFTTTNCYEGQDSFTFQVSDGQYASTGTVSLIIADPVSASPPAPPQTCRATQVGFTLYGSDNCGEQLYWQMASGPQHGSLSPTNGLLALPQGTANVTYTPTGTNYTGTDTFNFLVRSDCGGDTATNTVTITVGDVYIYPNPQSVMTGTNQPVTITLSAQDGDNCQTDTNYYTYTVTSGPTNSYLTGTQPNLTNTPNANYEGLDSFQFAVSDGVWTSSYPGTVTLYVVAGPTLFTECDPFGTAVQLDWSLDTNVLKMIQQDGLNLSGFIISRSTNSGGNYLAIATNTDISQMNYQDDTAVVGQTNYYVVNFESSESGVTYESPKSNEIEASGQNPDDLIPPDAFWNVVTNLADPTNVVRLQAPFSSYGTNQYPGLYPLPNTYWPPGSQDSPSTWSNHIALYIPSNVVPSQVQYSIAIDNNYQLYLNNSASYIDMTNHSDFATWAQFKSFESVAPGLLHQGTNDLGVVIEDVGGIDYFSMVVTTNTCGQ